MGPPASPPVGDNRSLPAPSMYKMPFAASKMLGEIRFFYGDFGTDKEFVEDKILELGVTVLGCQVRF